MNDTSVVPRAVVYSIRGCSDILAVDYRQTLKQMIRNCRCHVRDGVEKATFVGGSGVLRFRPAHFSFGVDTSSELAMEIMRADGYKVAKIEHLLALCQFLRGRQCSMLTVALGSIDESGLGVSVLAITNKNRELSQMFFQGRWPTDYSFLGYIEE